MKRLKVIVLTPAMGVAALIGLSGPAGAAEPPGRGASTGGLATAIQKVREAANAANDLPTESISLNILMAQDPDQPGTIPGGDGVDGQHNETLVRDRV